MKSIDDGKPAIDPITILCESINRVDCLPGYSHAQPDIWQIFIDCGGDRAEILEVTIDSLIKPTKFKQQFLKLFGKPMLLGLNFLPKWEKFVENLGAIRTTVIDDENPIQYAIGGLLEKLATFELTDDRNIFAISSTCLYRHNGFLCYHSKHILELLGEITRLDISEIGKYCNNKKIEHVPNTGTVVSIAGEKARCWWFYPDAFSEFQMNNEN